MKRAQAVQLGYPVGSIVAFRGDEWLSDLRGSLGLIVDHNNDPGVDPALCVLVNERVIEILCDEFEDEELELLGY